MKIKTRKLIAAITATALLGSALGIGTYAISNSNNDFGFKGTYDLTAFAAEQASESTITVAGVSIDTTSTLTLTSTNNDYTLFVTVVDTDDMTALADINVGYTVGGNTYNGQTSGLSNVVYSSLTVKTGNEETPTATATAAELAEDFTKISTAKLVIAEVEGVVSETATLTINASKIETYALSANDLEAKEYTSETTWSTKSKDAFVTIMATDALDSDNAYSQSITVDTNNKSVDGYSYAQRVKLGGAGTTKYKSIRIELTKSASVTVHAMNSSKNTDPARELQVLDSNGTALESIIVDAAGDALLSGSIQLDAGTYYLASKTGGFNIYGIIFETAGEVGKVIYDNVEVVEVPATCVSDGTAAHYIGSNGKLYVKNGDTYTEVSAEDLVIPAIGHKDENNNDICDNCNGAKISFSVVSSLEGADELATITTYGLTIAYDDIESAVTVPDGYTLSGIQVGDITYTEDNVTLTADTTSVTAVFKTSAKSLVITQSSGNFATGKDINLDEEGIFQFHFDSDNTLTCVTTAAGSAAISTAGAGSTSKRYFTISGCKVGQIVTFVVNANGARTFTSLYGGAMCDANGNQLSVSSKVNPDAVLTYTITAADLKDGVFGFYTSGTTYVCSITVQ